MTFFLNARVSLRNGCATTVFHGVLIADGSGSVFDAAPTDRDRAALAQALRKMADELLDQVKTQ